MKAGTIFVVLVALVSVVLAEPEEKKKQPHCGKHEQWNDCGPIEGGCPRECANRDDKNLICPAICIGACYCDLGYIRREYGGPCIPIRDCPEKYQTTTSKSKC